MTTKQISNRAIPNKVSVLVGLVAVVPLFLFCNLLITALLLGTAELENTCERLEPKYVECQPKNILIDSLLNQTRPKYLLKQAIIREGFGGLSLTYNSSTSYFRAGSNRNHHIYFQIIPNAELKSHHYFYSSPHPAQQKAREINQYIQGNSGNSSLTFYSDLPQKYLVIYISLGIFIWLIFIAYIFQNIYKLILVFKL